MTSNNQLQWEKDVLNHDISEAILRPILYL